MQHSLSGSLSLLEKYLLQILERSQLQLDATYATMQVLEKLKFKERLLQHFAVFPISVIRVYSLKSF